jgi:hypothetical protein
MTTSLARSRRRTIPFAVLVVAILSSLMTAFAPARPAAAYTWADDGRPGASQMPQARGYGGDPGLSELSFPRRYVWRSPATTGDQTVTVAVQIFKYNRYYNRYYLDSTWYTRTTIPRGYGGAWVPRMRMHPRATPGNFSIHGGIRWTSANGTNLGTRAFDYNAARDYVCMTGYPYRCNVGTVGGRGNVWLAW